MMSYFLKAVLPLTASILSVTDAPANDLVSCLKTENDLDRLACYDKLSGRTPVVVPAPTKGRWQAQTQKSAFTDQTTVVLAMDSNESPNCGWNRGAKVTLVLRCMENRTVVYFDTGCHMASSDYNSYGDIQYRVDDEKARTAKGDASTDYKSLGLWTGGRSIPFIKGILGKQKLTVRMTPFSENSFTVTFDVGGLDQSIPPLREACGW